MADDETYRTLFEAILQRHINLVGEKVALTAARKAPLEIDADGNLTGFYGEGTQALDILVDTFIQMAGEDVTVSRIRSIVEEVLDEDEYSDVPERVRPREETGDDRNGLLDRVRGLVQS